MLDYKLHKLPNGARLITAPLEKTKAVSILILFGAGSRFETKTNNGIAHFLEHMYFKGTKKRPTTLDISRELDSVGASYNAYTGEEMTGFYISAPSAHFEKSADVLTDMLFNSLFSAEEIAKEKGVIVEEINMYNDNPQAKVDLVFKELMYPDQPLGRNIAGSRATVTSFSRQTFTNFRDEFYRPSNMVVVIAGFGKENNWLSKMRERLSALKDESISKPLPGRINPASAPIKLDYKETDQAHFILGFPAISRLDKRRPAMKILTAIMGQMMSSRLFIEVRERRGLCYYVHADMNEFQDTGYWAVASGVDIKRIQEAIETILQEITKLKEKPITQEELTRAKENLKGHLYLGLEESLQIAEFLGTEELLWGKTKDPDEIAKEYDKVTAKDIQQLAKSYFIQENLKLAIVGPFKESLIFDKIIKKFK